MTKAQNIIHPQTLEFLKWLEDFNDKKFFELYKPLYLKIKENLVFAIKEIVETNKSSFAFPSQSIYVEKQ